MNSAMTQRGEWGIPDHFYPEVTFQLKGEQRDWVVLLVASKGERKRGD